MTSATEGCTDDEMGRAGWRLVCEMVSEMDTDFPTEFALPVLSLDINTLT